MPQDPFLLLALLVGYLIAILIGVIGIVIVIKMISGEINLNKLISESDGDASLSRFQFMIFTFVVAMSLLLMVVAQLKGAGPFSFPDTSTVLALLGISGGSYVVSKGIQKSYEGKIQTGNPAQADQNPQNQNPQNQQNQNQ